MAFVLEAVIGRPEVLRTMARSAVVVPLPQGMALVPMTDELFVALGGSPVLGCEKLPASLEPLLTACSSQTPVAYVEAEFFGGAGCQRAAVWVGGTLAGDPLFLDEDQPTEPAGTPISQALRLLGVERGDWHDEFAALDLGRHRETCGWLRE
ncbi:hypothetical protein SAMN05421812_11360 [Asanoa hainanensis]|uniref:Uncharacterized protein n=1 Tax=Asanoa hainanensis TaxID=560556 RepID=A0A239P2I9_9ACTN|nr:hypothetical protein [Asanoa hainanensis]SNT61305.1 hypothetical protein SAMN05421812_11360 [Asanoa hainanensis]